MRDDQLPIDISPRARGYALMLQGLVMALMGLGLVMIYSAQGRVDRLPFHDEILYSQASRQLLFASVAVLLMTIVSRFDYRRFRLREDLFDSMAFWMLVAAILLLISVYIPGVGLKVNNARRWMKLGPVTFQPSEFAKLALVVFLAGKLTDVNFPRKELLRGLLPISMVIGVVCGLIGVEDLGTAALIAMISGLMLLAGGVRVIYLVIPAVIALAGFIGLILVAPYRMSRLTTFMDIWADPQGSGYHAIQSLIAIASGEWWGLGLGEGIQKYGYLPEDTTDFIFSIIAEEIGMVGGMTVLGIFAVIVIVGWRIYRQASDDFGRMLVFGLISMIGLQAVINVAVATVSMPTKGIALPFVSAGGSGLIFSAIAVGLICSISLHADIKRTEDHL